MLTRREFLGAVGSALGVAATASIVEQLDRVIGLGTEAHYEWGCDEEVLEAAITVCPDEAHVVDGELRIKVLVDQDLLWQSVIVREVATGHEWKTNDGDIWNPTVGGKPTPEWLADIGSD